MTRKQRRTLLIASCLGVIGIAAGLVLFALSDKITYFRTPSDVAEQKVPAGQRFRLGGLVAEGSVKRGGGAKVEFAVTDTLKALPVTYQGILPDLFREGQGVVAEGVLSPQGVFVADTVLAKHDENYMPPEVAKSLKERGVQLGPGATHPGNKPADQKTGS
jgi:cytochrome c-type biogenesis protein CcmE